MRLIVARFDHSNGAHAARRWLLRTWPSAHVQLVRCPDGTELRLTVDDALEGPALYVLHRRGASLEADIEVDRPA
jgi:hypothetical protein